ncbi:cytochrome P450 3A29 [Nematostella vectensis]|uniref:cytochrome P450 3A29 n=1 Tax=Nematostella vectensis TaxID=45351 RepID=UPI002076E287|nr:cytochrome P450 3A29 [Nematostella vectensis]
MQILDSAIVPNVYFLAGTLILLIVLAVIYWVGVSSFRVLKGLNIPGPPPLPYIGNLRDIQRLGGIHVAPVRLMQEYGKVFAWSVGRTPAIVVGDPEILKHVMVKEFQNFRNRFLLFRDTRSEMRHGMFSATDDKWKRIRSTLTPTFTSGKLRQMTPKMRESCDTLMDKIGKVADTGESVDILGMFCQMTLEVILSTAFGIDSEVQKNPNNTFSDKAKEIFKSPTFLRMFLMLPFASVFFKIFRFLIHNNNMKYFIDLSKEILSKRHDKTFNRKDFVDLMLSAVNPDGSRKLSDPEIIAQSVTFLLAGHETSSNALSATAYYLALNPEVQERLRLEIRMAAETNSDKSPHELANDLEYLDCVVNEVLRLHPPVHTMNRECAQACVINGITIPAGMDVTIPFYSLHHDPDAWPEPDKFDPERFRGPAKESRHPFQFIPFGAGPRNCIGMRFALNEVKLVLFQILSKYKFVRSPDTQVPLVLIPGATLIPRDGIYLRIETA